MNPLSTTKGILAAVAQDPKLSQDPNLTKTYLGLGGTLSNNAIPSRSIGDITQNEIDQNTSGVLGGRLPGSSVLNQDKPGYDTFGNPVVPAKQPISDTTLSNYGLVNETVPQNNRQLDVYSSKGSVMGADGVARYADGTMVPDSTASNSDTQGETPEEKRANELIAQMKESLDASTKAQVDAIHQTFQSRKNAQNDINDRLLKSREQGLLMGGSSRYAPLSSSGIITAQESYGLKELADLDAQENSLIAAARQAQESGNQQLLSKQLELIETKRKEKATLAADIAKNAAAENMKVREHFQQTVEAEQAAESEAGIIQLMSEGINDPVKIFKKLRDGGVSSITFDQIADITDRMKIAEKAAPGIVGEWMAAIENDPTLKGLKLMDYIKLKDPTAALDLEEKSLQIDKLRRDLAGGGTNTSIEEASNLLAYAQQYASTGVIPTNLPKGTFGAITQTAKELPKPQGTLVDINTGVRPSKMTSEQVTGVSSLYDLTNKLTEAKELFHKFVPGLISGTFAKAIPTEAIQRYNAARSEIVDLLARARSGAAITEYEAQQYEKKLPSTFNQSLFLGQSGDTLIDSLKSSISGKLDSILKVNGAALYGYSKVEGPDGSSYTIGDIITNSKGQQGRVNPDGTISPIE